MKKEELQKVVDIISRADGGCGCCVNNLAEQMIEEFKINKQEMRKMLKIASPDAYWIEELKDWFKEED